MDGHHVPDLSSPLQRQRFPNPQVQKGDQVPATHPANHLTSNGLVGVLLQQFQHPNSMSFPFHFQARPDSRLTP